MNLRKPTTRERTKYHSGFSIIELLIVLLVISILMIFSVRFTSARLYKPDQQAQLFLDIFKEAKQRAITQKETIRVEINQTNRTIRLITENTSGDLSDDQEIRKLPLANTTDVVFDSAPQNIDSRPIEPTPVPDLVYKTPLNITGTSTDKVATLRFLKNGNVMDAGLNSVGDGASITGATIFFWTPTQNEDGTLSDDGQVIRAITVLGNSGTTRHWKCAVEDGQCAVWEK